MGAMVRESVRLVRVVKAVMRGVRTSEALVSSETQPGLRLRLGSCRAARVVESSERPARAALKAKVRRGPVYWAVAKAVLGGRWKGRAPGAAVRRPVAWDCSTREAR